MKSAFFEIIKVAVKRAHEPQKIVGHLLQAEIAGRGYAEPDMKVLWTMAKFAREEGMPFAWVLICLHDHRYRLKISVMIVPAVALAAAKNR